jgi:hypothetical protein
LMEQVERMAAAAIRSLARAHRGQGAWMRRQRVARCKTTGTKRPLHEMSSPTSQPVELPEGPGLVVIRP